MTVPNGRGAETPAATTASSTAASSTAKPFHSTRSSLSTRSSGQANTSALRPSARSSTAQEGNGQDGSVNHDSALRIEGEHVIVRAVEAADIPALEVVMAGPGVRAWWWDFEVGKFAAE